MCDKLGLDALDIYNVSAFDSLEFIRLLNALSDIYLPDFKVWMDCTFKCFLKADRYTETAMNSMNA